METSKKQTSKGLVLSLVGLVACIAALFMPWFDNTQISVTGLSTVATFGATLVVVIAAGVLVAAVLAFCTGSAEGKKRTVLCGLRALGVVFAAYALMGGRKLMVNGQDNLPVTMLAGAYVMLAGLAILLIGAVSDLLSFLLSVPVTLTVLRQFQQSK